MTYHHRCFCVGGIHPQTWHRQSEADDDSAHSNQIGIHSPQRNRETIA
jgi:hypothetical protein